MHERTCVAKGKPNRRTLSWLTTREISFASSDRRVVVEHVEGKETTRFGTAP